MRYLSVCSGIEAATSAWHPLGWQPEAFSEIEPFPSAVLAHHYPHVPNVGDMTKFKEWKIGPINLLVGGTPCQSFSVAGLRKGLADPRGNLMLTYLAIAAKHKPRWLVWENVPGVLSSNGGKDFGTLLGGLAELGYGFAYRILDAQYTGVPQRRRRVFVVGCLGDWRSAAAVLFERHSVSGHPAPRREAGKAAPTIPSRSTGGGGLGADFECDGGLIPSPHADISPAIKARDSKGVSSDGDGDGAILVPMTLAVRGRQGESTLEFREDGTANAILTPSGGRAGIGVGAVAFAQNQRDEVRLMDVAGTLASEPGMKQQTYLHHAMQVRRLTPRECERLQGFPDDYTAIQIRNKPAADGPRYKALGNSMAVPCMAWIGQRIARVDANKRKVGK